MTRSNNVFDGSLSQLTNRRETLEAKERRKHSYLSSVYCVSHDLHPTFKCRLYKHNDLVSSLGQIFDGKEREGGGEPHDNFPRETYCLCYYKSTQRTVTSCGASDLDSKFRLNTLRSSKWFHMSLLFRSESFEHL